MLNLQEDSNDVCLLKCADDLDTVNFSPGYSFDATVSSSSTDDDSHTESDDESIIFNSGEQKPNSKMLVFLIYLILQYKYLWLNLITKFFIKKINS